MPKVNALNPGTALPPRGRSPASRNLFGWELGGKGMKFAANPLGSPLSGDSDGDNGQEGKAESLKGCGHKAEKTFEKFLSPEQIWNTRSRERRITTISQPMPGLCWEAPSGESGIADKMKQAPPWSLPTTCSCGFWKCPEEVMERVHAQEYELLTGLDMSLMYNILSWVYRT